MRLDLTRATIRSWSVDDAASLQRYANNRNVWINLRDMFPHPYTMEDAHVFLNRVTKQKPETVFAIVTDSEAIGGIGLHLGQDVHCKTAEFGYWLAEPFWGKGIMSEVVSGFVRFAFENFDLERIYAIPFEPNPASARILEKSGFIYEGRMRANVFKDGKVLDSFLYARTRE